MNDARICELIEQVKSETQEQLNTLFDEISEIKKQLRLMQDTVIRHLETRHT